MSVAVAIMAKAPRPGDVKTRLCPPLSPVAAATLYRCFLLDKLEQVRALKGVHPVVAYTPDDGRFHGQISEVMAALPEAEVWAGIGSYLTGLEGTVRKIRIARELGTHGIVLFSYDWAVAADGGGGEVFLERVGRSSFAR